MQAIFLQLLNMSITASWLVLAVIILRFVFKNAPKAFRVILWALVGIRLICPFSVGSSLSLIPSAQTVPVENLYTEIPVIESGIPVINEVVNAAIEDRIAEEKGEQLNSNVGAANDESKIAAVNPVVNITQIASAAWVIGMAGLLLYTAASYFRIHRKVREAAPFAENIWLCDHIATPFILGVIRPRIYLPSTMDERDMEYVIAHEKAHIKRHDHWWKPLGFLLLTIYWFNPVMWIVYVLLCRDIELACDEKVIREMGIESKKPYSEALINCSVPRRMIAACPLAFGEIGVKGRIKSVLNYKKPGFWVMVAAVIVYIGVSVCFLTDPVEELDADLQVLIDCEIASHHQSEESENYFCCLDWEVLGTKKSGNQTTVYLWVLYQEYSHNGGLTVESGSHIPTAITVDNDGDSYELVEYWIPRDGSYYEEDIRDKFPAYLWGKALNSQAYYDEQSAACDQLAQEYFAQQALGNQSDETTESTSVHESADDLIGMELPNLSTENVIRYVYNYSVDPIDPTIALNPDEQSFMFSFSGFSSFLCYGKYEITGDMLILRVYDGETVYKFKTVDDTYVFLESESSKVPRYKYSSSASGAVSPVPDGAVFEPEVTSETVLTKVPELVVVFENETIAAEKGPFDWSYDKGDGTWSSIIACGYFILEYAEDVNALELQSNDNLVVWLQFGGVDPDNITVGCWNLDEQNPEREEVEVNGLSFKLKAGNYVYEIDASWKLQERLFGGSAQYSFRTKNISE